MKAVIHAFVVACSLLPALAHAQGAPVSPFDEALGGRLTKEINDGLQCNTSRIATERELAQAKAKIIDLEKQIQDLKPADEKK